MTLPSSGAMRLGANVNVELGNSSTAQISLGQSTVRALYGVASGAIRLAADGYGKSSAVYQVFTTIGFQTWTVPSGITKIKSVEAIGGGAVGGGAYAKSTDITVTPGQTVYIRVGQGANGAVLQSNSWLNVSSNSQPTLTSQGVLAVCPIEVGSGNPQGGLATNCVGTIKYSGGGSIAGAGGFGGLGGGGAAGPNGNGASGGAPSPSSSSYYGTGGGGGGGGANGGSSGSNATDTLGGTGGNGPGGTGGGSGSSSASIPGGSATANTGGGGGGGWGGFGQVSIGSGGDGAMYPIAEWGNYGPGGGAGGYGHSSPFGGGGKSGKGGNYGGGSQGGGSGQGIVVIYY
jgi:hypothetical protein